MVQVNLENQITVEKRYNSTQFLQTFLFLSTLSVYLWTNAKEKPLNLKFIQRADCELIDNFPNNETNICRDFNRNDDNQGARVSLRDFVGSNGCSNSSVAHDRDYEEKL